MNFLQQALFYKGCEKVRGSSKESSSYVHYVCMNVCVVSQKNRVMILITLSVNLFKENGYIRSTGGSPVVPDVCYV
jgi:hypothetical protein